MILADKIIKLRKSSGLSQEELADKLNVSRQAVSKWESATAIPSLEKILQLSELFGVTSDYLLKDEIETEESTSEENNSVIKISLETANDYLASRKSAAKKIALASVLCILSPITLLMLAGASASPNFSVSETFAGVIGLIVLFAFVACAVPLFMYSRFKNSHYEFLDKDIPFELEYGVKGIVNERIKQFKGSYTLYNIIGTCLCIFAPVPIIASAFTEKDFLAISMLCVTLVIVAVAVYMFVFAGVRYASMQKLLKQGDYTGEGKKRNRLKEAVSSIYWGIAVALFLLLSFLTNKWNLTWIVFAVAGVLSPVVMAICNLISKNKEN